MTSREDVASFATGSPGLGWLLKKTVETKSGWVDYDSRQGTPGEGPRLVVVFTTLTTVDTTPPTASITAPLKGASSPARAHSHRHVLGCGHGVDLRASGWCWTAWTARPVAGDGSGLSFTPSAPLRRQPLGGRDG